jgi:hypothetical protein
MAMDKNYVHVSLVADFVQAMMRLVSNLTDADIHDICLVISSELKKTGIIDESNFLDHCKKLIYIDNKANRLH